MQIRRGTVGRWVVQLFVVRKEIGMALLRVALSWEMSEGVRCWWSAGVKAGPWFMAWCFVSGCKTSTKGELVLMET